MIYKDLEFTKLPEFDHYYMNKETQQLISTRPGRNCFAGQIKELKPTINQNGYYHYTLKTSDGKSLNRTHHRIFMELFVPNQEGLYAINHIDGNKTNNSIENLEWCTLSHNSQHAYTTGLANSDHCIVPIHVYNIHGQYLQSFDSIANAERELGIDSANIVEVAKGRNSITRKGLIFSYLLQDSIEPYSGPDLLKEIKIVNLDTKEESTFTTVISAANYLNINRAKLLRRFKKGNEFYIENFKITRINY